MRLRKVKELQQLCVKEGITISAVLLVVICCRLHSPWRIVLLLSPFRLACFANLVLFACRLQRRSTCMDKHASSSLHCCSEPSAYQCLSRPSSASFTHVLLPLPAHISPSLPAHISPSRPAHISPSLPAHISPSLPLSFLALTLSSLSLPFLSALTP
eukprot:820771-Pleurochrysis_carterae.AAC.2